MGQYQFDIIEDTRRNKYAEQTLDEHHREIAETFKGLPVRLSFSAVRAVKFGPPEPCVSYRRTYTIGKDTRKISWNTIFGLINSIQAPFYKRL